MLVKLIHLDGAMPNLALMKLAHWHRSRDDDVTLTRRIQPRLDEAAPDIVYASSIFEKTGPRIAETLAAYPDAIIGGTGTDKLTTHRAGHRPSPVTRNTITQPIPHIPGR